MSDDDAVVSDERGNCIFKVDTDAEKQAWREIASANGVVIASVDLNDRDDMKELYEIR